MPSGNRRPTGQYHPDRQETQATSSAQAMHKLRNDVQAAKKRSVSSLRRLPEEMWPGKTTNPRQAESVGKSVLTRQLFVVRYTHRSDARPGSPRTTQGAADMNATAFPNVQSRPRFYPTVRSILVVAFNKS